MKSLRNLVRAKKLLRSFDTSGGIGKKTLLELIPKAELIVEIGAHKGLDTEELALTFPKARVISFEASPNLYVNAFNRCKKLANVTLIPAALANKSGVTRFNQSSGASDGSGSLLDPGTHLQKYPNVFFEPENIVIIPTITLDEYLDVVGAEKIDLIWIDAQGAEGLVFEGAHKYLSRTNYVYSEVANISEYSGGISYSDLTKLLNTYGLYVLKEFLPEKWNGVGNVLFARS